VAAAVSDIVLMGQRVTRALDRYVNRSDPAAQQQPSVSVIMSTVIADLWPLYS
jgi:hypothetical protein